MTWQVVPVVAFEWGVVGSEEEIVVKVARKVALQAWGENLPC